MSNRPWRVKLQVRGRRKSSLIVHDVTLGESPCVQVLWPTPMSSSALNVSAEGFNPILSDYLGPIQTAQRLRHYDTVVDASGGITPNHPEV